MTVPTAVSAVTGLRSYAVTAAVALLVGAGGGLGFGWHFWRPKSVVETPAASVRQPDSSLILQRAPDAGAKPAQEIPKGATVERVVHLEVQPRAIVRAVVAVGADSLLIVHAGSVPVGPALTAAIPTKTDSSRLGSPVLCPPIGVDLTLIRLKDGTQRVVASSKDGLVLDSLSVDRPVSDVAQPRALAWSAGPIWGGGDNGVGVNLTRDLGPLRLMGAVLRAPPRGPVPLHAVGLLAVNIRF